jgi:hypothetical protein
MRFRLLYVLVDASAVVRHVPEDIQCSCNTREISLSISSILHIGYTQIQVIRKNVLLSNSDVANAASVHSMIRITHHHPTDILSREKNDEVDLYEYSIRNASRDIIQTLQKLKRDNHLLPMTAKYIAVDG